MGCCVVTYVDSQVRHRLQLRDCIACSFIVLQVWIVCEITEECLELGARELHIILIAHSYIVFRSFCTLRISVGSIAYCVIVVNSIAGRTSERGNMNSRGPSAVAWVSSLRFGERTLFAVTT